MPCRPPHQPVAFDAGLLRIGAEMGLAQSPAIEDDIVARRPAGMARSFHRAGEIDAGDHREAAHHRRLAGQSEAVLVIHRRPFDANGDVAVHQILLVEIGELDRLAGLRLVDHDRLERCHVVSPGHTSRSARSIKAGRRLPNRNFARNAWERERRRRNGLQLRGRRVLGGDRFGRGRSSLRRLRRIGLRVARGGRRTPDRRV